MDLRKVLVRLSLLFCADASAHDCQMEATVFATNPLSMTKSQIESLRRCVFKYAQKPLKPDRDQYLLPSVDPQSSLPSDEDAENVAALFPGHTRGLTPLSSLGSRTQNLTADDLRVLHFATHGIAGELIAPRVLLSPSKFGGLGQYSLCSFEAPLIFYPIEKPPYRDLYNQGPILIKPDPGLGTWSAKPNTPLLVMPPKGLGKDREPFQRKE